MQYCTNCGKEKIPENKFCIHCGQKFKEKLIKKDFTPPKATEYSPQPLKYPQEYSYQQLYPRNFYKTPPPNEKKDAKNIIIVIVVILAILISSGLFFFLSSNNGSNPSNDNEAENNDYYYNNLDNDQNWYYEDCGEGNFTRHYTWEFDGEEHNFRICIPEAIYYYLTKQPRTFEYTDYVQVAEYTLIKLADALEDMAEEYEYNSIQTVNFILSFVQCLEYTSDKETTGYDEFPRFATETLVERGGDCEDTSILFAGFMEILGYDSILLFLPSDSPTHAAVGVNEESAYGSYIEVSGLKYFYCETTAGGWEIGDCPDIYKDTYWSYIEV